MTSASPSAPAAPGSRSTAPLPAAPPSDELLHMMSLGEWEWTPTQGMRTRGLADLRLLEEGHATAAHWRDLLALVPEAQRAAIHQAFDNALDQRLPRLRYDFHVERQGVRRDFHGRVQIAYLGDGQPRRLFGSLQDITDLRDYRWQLHSVALFDPVTSLPNRALLVKRIQAVLENATGEGREFGVLIVGLDQFKHIHDSLGHAAGEALLQEAARRLSVWLRDYDTVASLGGDEFAVLLPEVREPDDLGRIASKLLQSFVSSFTVSGTEVFITASIGAALFPLDADSADELLQHADIALSHARAKGRNNIEFYARQLTAQASERLALESDLRRGIERGELRLHYQPKFELGSQRLVGAEALMRWQHPQRGMVSPLSFIPMAEETGLIVRMGTWALREACQTVAGWNTRSARPLKVAVNLSARQFGEGDFVQTVTAALSATGCLPQWLEIEITESLLIDARDDIRVCLETLSGMGITVALDDFGTGYSTLSYLTRLPVQTLKVDRSFVKDLPHNRNSMELARAIVSLGRGLDMVVVAEGIETPEQADFLREIGCTLAQGFLFGRPVESSAFEALLTTV